MLWQRMKIEGWTSLFGLEELNGVPQEVLNFLADIGTPIRVFKKGVFQVNSSGLLRGIQKEEDKILITVKADGEEKNVEIKEGAGLAISIPVLQH